MTDRESPEQRSDSSPDDEGKPRLISVYEERASAEETTCLRPLGLCELGGCCDSCWYSPDHPRFKGGG